MTIDCKIEGNWRTTATVDGVLYEGARYELEESLIEILDKLCVSGDRPLVLTGLSRRCFSSRIISSLYAVRCYAEYDIKRQAGHHVFTRYKDCFITQYDTYWTDSVNDFVSDNNIKYKRIQTIYKNEVLKVADDAKMALLVMAF